MCRSALVLATTEGREALKTLGAPVREAWDARAHFIDVAMNIKNLTVFDLDIDTAQAHLLDEDESLDLTQYPDIAEIMASIDGELLDSIGSLWYRGKGWPDPEQTALTTTTRIPGWKQGQQLAWDAACTGVRQDLYALDEGLYEALDFYCPIPECECDEVNLRFEPASSVSEPSPGYVNVQLSGVAKLIPAESSDPRLEPLWTAFRQRHPRYLERFAHRNTVMKTIGARLIAKTIGARLIALKVGRNDPCPCGSGKKYKKCCATSG
jgi:hypothetical protein